VQKNIGFFEIYGVSAQTRGFDNCGQGGGVNFRDFVRMSFMDGPLVGLLYIFIYRQFTETALLVKN